MQSVCGSCVAFAAHALHEAALIKAGASSTNLDLSEQYLLDCAFDGNGANGCLGAFPSRYTDWFVNDAGGLSPLETDYPYVMKWYHKTTHSPANACNTTIEKYDPGYKMSSMNWTYQCNEETMKSVSNT